MGSSTDSVADGRPTSENRNGPVRLLVSTLFVSASNELGEAYSGVMVRLLGAVGAAVFGGFGALAATGAWSAMFPGLRKADRLT